MTAEAFRFRGGRLCLDFAATLGAQYRDPIERLATPADLVRWVELAIPGSDAAVARASAMPDGAVLAAAHELRAAIRRLVHPATGENPQAADIVIVNDWAARPGFASVLGPDARSAWLDAGKPAEAGLAVVAGDAIDLLSGPWRSRVRECGRPDCSLLFLDKSRQGQRRWCDMESCGNLMKARRYRQAHRTGAAG
ncbi:MAG: ABATE domain-containing protein [Streptosporangiaceae bacterium]|nr:ABATE domain-containing protein [Streptosporangiaceae bacterium]